MEPLNEKIIRIFGDLAVDKRLARMREVARLPRFISEYLISRYKDPDELSQVVTEYYPDPSEKDKVLNRLKTEGSVKLIDEFKVDVDLKHDIYRLHIPCLQIYDAIASESIVKSYERILSGLWGMGLLEYRSNIAEQNSISLTPIILTDFKPFQVYSIDVKEFIDARRKFTLDEWVDLLVQSVGLNPKMYSDWSKLLLLMRLTPLVEGNINLLELGPRATGKTYLYRNISYYTRIYAGGTISPARLFFDARLRVVGDIGTRDVVIFDEISRIKFSSPEVVAKLKDYMVDGHFERATLKRAHSDCSIVFLGNLDISELMSIIDYLPDFMKDQAFLDRIHGIIPGWELPKIKKSELHLAQGYGLAVDYLSEIFHQLRKYDVQPLIEESIELIGDYTIRDERGVIKLLSGLFKLTFPHGEFDRSELKPMASLAVKARQMVADELSRLSPVEFPSKKLEFQVRG